MKLLLADDDLALAEVIAFALRRAGFLVVTAADGAQALKRCEDEAPDLVLLDVQMPGMSGLEVCRALRARSDVPIILLTVLAGDDNVVEGFRLGADDYVTKPFSPRQLVARIEALLRRKRGVVAQGQLRAGGLTLDPSQHIAITDRGPLRLTRLEFRLLHYLLVNQGQVVPTEAIVSHVWGYRDGDRGLLKQLVFRLRQKIAGDGEPGCTIDTVPGIGYTIPRQNVTAP